MFKISCETDVIAENSTIPIHSIQNQIWVDGRVKKVIWRNKSVFATIGLSKFDITDDRMKSEMIVNGVRTA